jgi:predicted MFS family arabinose efflux permease
LLLIIAGILVLRPGSYRVAFILLAIPVCAALGMLFYTRIAFPAAGAGGHELEQADNFRYPQEFWWYAAGAALIGFGFVDWPLVAYHFAKSGTVGGPWVPVFYALAMGAGGLGSLAFGKPFDRFGLIVLVPLTVVVAAFAPLVFYGGFAIALVGALLWGVGLGIHESVMTAAIATMIPQERRGAAFGLFTSIFGVSWFVGSAAEGALYDVSIEALVTLALVAQLAGIFPILRAYVYRRAMMRGPTRNHRPFSTHIM